MRVRRVTLLGSILAALCVYGMCVPGPAPPHRLTVRGTQYALPGEPVLLRALLHDHENDRPVPGVEVAAREYASGAVVARSRTGPHGEARLELPAGLASIGDASLSCVYPRGSG